MQNFNKNTFIFKSVRLFEISGFIFLRNKLNLHAPAEIYGLNKFLKFLY